MKKKLQSRSGETLVETLFALLVIVLAFTMLAGSIVSAARINQQASDLDPAFRMEKGRAVGGAAVIITHSDDRTTTIPVEGYRTEDDNTYCYYQ